MSDMKIEVIKNKDGTVSFNHLTIQQAQEIWDRCRKYEKLQAQLTTAKEGGRAAAGILDDLAKKLKEITGEQNVWEAVKQLATANDENKRRRREKQELRR